MASDEVLFLRDQVHRLNTALAEYQQKYPALSLPAQGTDDAEKFPWSIDKQLLSPLLTEYDTCIQICNDQVETYKEGQKDLRSQVDRLIAENQRLRRELKEVVQTQLENVDVGDLTPAVEDDQVLHNLQQQLQMALQEKESAVEMWQAAAQEVERLEQGPQSQLNPHLHSIEKQASQIKGQYMQTVTELNNEIALLQDEVRKSKNEEKASAIQVTDLRRTLDEMKTQLMRKEEERTVAQDRGYSAGSHNDELLLKIRELETQVADTDAELNRLKDEKKMIQQRLVDLQKKSADSEQREYEAVLHVRNSVQMSENAMMEKDQALIREQQAEEQLQQMQAAFTKLVDEAGARTRQEVDNVKKQCNENISRLMEEIYHLEMESSEKQAQMDRAIREKRAVESELEKIYQEGMIKGTKDSVTHEDLNRRACNAERLREEAMVKLDSSLNQLKRTQMDYDKDKRHLSNEVTQLRERIDTINEEFGTVNDDRVKLLEEIDGLKRKIQATSQDRDAAQRNFTKQMACMERDIKMKDQEYEVRLQSLEDCHRHSMLETRNMLGSQQRMSAKWKEECQAITHKFEVKVTDLRSDNARQKKRNDDLTKLLRESKEKTGEAEEMLSEYAHNIKRMEDRIREAESRANNKSLQVSKQMSQARNLKFSSSRNPTFSSSQRSTGPEALNLADLQGITGMNAATQKGSVHFSASTDIDPEDRANR